MNNNILCGDALHELQKLESDSIDLIATDPPYGYSFMNKDWDKAVVGVQTWKECLRVLKAGAFAFVMSSPRQDVLAKMVVNLIDAGFETNFTSIYWTYASGFPKAADVSMLIDKRFNAEREIVGTKQTKNQLNIKGGNFTVTGGNPIMGNLPITKPATQQAQKLEGAYCGFQPKPAVEVVLVVMKPLSEKSYVDQALQNGKGITWLDDCRIPFDIDTDEQPRIRVNKRSYSHRTHEVYGDFAGKKCQYFNQKGRFPANLLVSDDVLNDGKITKSDGGTRFKKFGYRHYCENAGYDHITEQGKDKALTTNQPKDSGSFSRYFDLDKWFDTTFPFLITPKASKSEKNTGLDKWISQTVNDGRQKPIDNPFQRGETLRINTHPTVKPLKLMSYLITLGSRPNDIVLDPFCGSGTTCIAAKMLKRRYLGIELNPEYVNIADARLAALQDDQSTLFEMVA